MSQHRRKRGRVFIHYWRQHGERVLLESANTDCPPIDFPLAEIASAWTIVQTVTAGKIKKC